MFEHQTTFNIRVLTDRSADYFKDLRLEAVNRDHAINPAVAIDGSDAVRESSCPSSINGEENTCIWLR